MKNLYLIYQDSNDDYDTYDSAVVCAESEEAAKDIRPYPYHTDGCIAEGSWVSKEFVKVKHIGIAADNIKLGTVICASFNAG